jgi:hypothetical protein
VIGGWRAPASALALLAACARPGAPLARVPQRAPPPSGPVAAREATTTAAATAAAIAEEPFVFTAYDVNHVLSTGQSLAVGVSGAPALTTSQPFGNLMFNSGVMAGSEELESFEPLVEGDTIPGSKAVVETMSSSFANLVSAISIASGSERRHDILMSVHASGAKTYAQLKKGTRPYATGLAQVEAAKAIAARMGKSYVVRAVTTVHGESDHAEKSTRYAIDMLAWQADYERDVQAITGQKEPIPMFESQISSWTRMMRGTETSAIPAAQLAAHVTSQGKVVLVGPKYHLGYVKDGVHLTANGYRHMGEDYAKAYRRVVLEGKRWEPLRPIAITRDGATITVRFVVPAPPIVLDTTLVSDPGSYGLSYTDSSATSPAIERVEISAPDALTITLSAPPTGDDKRLRYAFSGTRGARSGPLTGARGNLRDSDPTPSRTGHRLYNWCVHFDEPVP